MKNSKIRKVVLLVIAGLYIVFSIYIAVTHTEGYEIYTRLPDVTLITPEDTNDTGGFAIDFCNDVWVSNDASKLRDVISASSDSYVISGWAIDVIENTCLSGVYITANNKTILCEYGISRDDIAAAFGSEECRESGFTVKVPAKMVKGSDGALIDSISFYLLCKSNDKMIGPFTYIIN